jgi:hypothetical protein
MALLSVDDKAPTFSTKDQDGKADGHAEEILAAIGAG